MQGESGEWREENEKWKKGGRRWKGTEGREDGWKIEFSEQTKLSDSEDY